MEGIDREQLENFIIAGLHEDVRDGDHTSLACIPSDKRSKARLLVKDDGVIAGVELAEIVFKHLDPTTEFTVAIPDGSAVKYGDEAFYVECNAQALLKGERLVLNTMQRMSGISSLSATYAKEVEGTGVTILDTRKTTPLLRFLEKWAVRIGGCTNYRDGLYDWIMIKDNHIDACGSITAAVNRVQEYFDKNKMKLGITVEVRDLDELHEALEVGNITRVMLDNFSTPLMHEAVKIVDGRCETEASGGITITRLKEIAETGVNFISTGALTHSAGSLDLSLKVMK